LTGAPWPVIKSQFLLVTAPNQRLSSAPTQHYNACRSLAPRFTAKTYTPLLVETQSFFCRRRPRLFKICWPLLFLLSSPSCFHPIASILSHPPSHKIKDQNLRYLHNASSPLFIFASAFAQKKIHWRITGQLVIHSVIFLQSS